MSRWKACFIHFTLSALVLGTLGALLVWRWYPPALIEVTGADTVLLLIAVVDLVMGPLLTLVVYEQGKKGLKFDLVMIALMQVGAMLYGLHTAWKTRPVYLVASDRVLTLVTANEFSAAVMKAAPDGYRRLPAFGPRVVGLKEPGKGEEALLAVAGPRLPSQFRPYQEVASRLAGNSTPVLALPSSLDRASGARLEEAVRGTGRPADSVGAVPVVSIRGRATMLLDRRTGELLRPVRVRTPTPADRAPPLQTPRRPDPSHQE